jgi:integrase
MDNKRHKSGEVDIKNGEVMAKSETKPKRLPKTHKDYWKQRVEKLTYKDKATGQTVEAGQYSVRLSHLKRREYFNLSSSNRVNAGDEAKRIFNFLSANGWEATLAEYKPEADAKPEIETVGDLIEAAKEKADVRPLTFRQYLGALRRIVSGIKGFDSSDASKFQPGGSKWQAKVDKVKLADITAEKLQKWRKRQLDKLNPAERKQKEVSLSSTLNQARSIWKHSGLPNPFAGLKWKQTAKRFQPSVEAPTLLYWAEQELKDKEDRREELKAFMLCLFLGLRKREADCLTWQQIDFEASKLKIQTTEFFTPKSENSERDIPVQASLLAMLSKWREGADNTFVLHGGMAKPLEEFTYYRAEETWKGLTTWLRSKGVDTPKPVHYLRKLAGSLMYGANDVYAAQRFLGHSDIRTTIGSYVHEGEKSFDLVSEKPGPKLVPDVANG